MKPVFLTTLSGIVVLMLVILISQARSNEDLRDPFVSLGDKLALAQGPAEAVQLPYPVILKGTLCAKNIYAAIVNNDMIRQGEKWQDFYVVKIENGLVILEWRDKKFEIRMKPEKEITPPEKISGQYVQPQIDGKKTK